MDIYSTTNAASNHSLVLSLIGREGRRLKLTSNLRQATEAYRQQTGQPAQTLDQLVSAGLIAGIPVDPFGVGYALDSAGVPIFGGVKVDAYGNKH